MVTNIRLQLAYDKGTFTFSRLDHRGDNEGFFNLATSFNSIQSEEAKIVRKIVRSVLL